ncbi:MAG: ThuA domain-containing protein [Saprospiraceae bacterium]|nr:ThuA domain-containing protein [Saprospiraceae bacterium]
MTLACWSGSFFPGRALFGWITIGLTLLFLFCCNVDPSPRILIFSKTAGHRHACIPAATDALRQLCREHGYLPRDTENAAELDAENLKHYNVVVFLCTSGNVLDAAQQSALEQFIRKGGGLAGIHSAADTEYDWPIFGQIIGARFKDHSNILPAQLRVVDTQHPATCHLPTSWSRTDEWYNFTAVQPNLQVLLRIDETSYSGGSMGENHPMAWCQPFGNGRVFYTALGHTEASYAEPAFLNHLLGGIQYAAGR